MQITNTTTTKSTNTEIKRQKYDWLTFRNESFSNFPRKYRWILSFILLNFRYNGRRCNFWLRTTNQTGWTKCTCKQKMKPVKNFPCKFCINICMFEIEMAMANAQDRQTHELPIKQTAQLYKSNKNEVTALFFCAFKYD